MDQVQPVPTPPKKSHAKCMDECQFGCFLFEFVGCDCEKECK